MRAKSFRVCPNWYPDVRLVNGKRSKLVENGQPCCCTSKGLRENILTDGRETSAEVSPVPAIGRSAWVLGAAGLLAGSIAVLLFYCQRGWPEKIAEPPLRRLECVSYAHPSSPFERAHDREIPQQVLEREVDQIAQLADCLRLYSSDRGQDRVVDIAARKGLAVILGVWLGADTEGGRADFERAISLANSYPATIKLLVVGNEVLLRREMSESALIAYVLEAKRRVGTTVTSAEVPTVWQDYPALAAAVDLVTVHLFPYWHVDKPDIDSALDLVDRVVSDLARRYPDKPIFLGEVGWPSAGRPRGRAVPGLVEEARFVRGLAARAADRGWAYNILEAFDQPWKMAFEGTVGGSWGVLSADGRLKFSLDGPVSALPDWWAIAATGLAIGLILWGTATRRAPSARPGRMLLAGPAAPVFGAVVGHALWSSAKTVATWPELFLHGACLICSFVYAVVLLETFLRGRRLEILSSTAAMATLRTGRLWPRRGRTAFLASLTMAGLRVGAAATGLALVFDARFRDFPVEQFLIPAIAGVAAFRLHPGSRPGAPDRALAGLLLASGLGTLFIDGTGTVRWALLSLLLAIPLLRWSPNQDHAADHDGRCSRQGMAERQTDDPADQR
jgi:glucan 1,3-beta-glucosidase